MLVQYRATVVPPEGASYVNSMALSVGGTACAMTFWGLLGAAQTTDDNNDPAASKERKAARAIRGLFKRVRHASLKG